MHFRESNIIAILECADAMANCSQCSTYNTCTACDGGLVVNATGDGCTGKINYHKNVELSSKYSIEKLHEWQTF